MGNKNVSKVKYYILFASALFILVFFFDSKSSKSESHLNKLVHDLHMTNDLHAAKTSIAVTQQKFKDTKGQEPQSISKPVESLKINQDNVIESKQKEKKFSNALI